MLPADSGDGPRPPCRVLEAELGYLMSATRPGQGAFSLACVGGCACVHKATPFTSLHPFPWVETDAAKARETHFKANNISVTAKTAFIVMLNTRAAQPCGVRVRHEVTRDRARSAPSRVRIDSLLLGHISGSTWNYTVNHRSERGADKHKLRQFAAECRERGTDLGQIETAIAYGRRI